MKDRTPLFLFPKKSRQTVGSRRTKSSPFRKWYLHIQHHKISESVAEVCRKAWNFL
ncbi:MAG: hypothetical protein IIY78_08005 [Clostridia bacterium]|nr:hypothetical protein [Clostridia bacterium]